MPKAMLIDVTLCIGCEACSQACRETNHLPVSTEKVLTANTFQTVNEVEKDVFIRRQCMHCLEPACVSVCPVGALAKHPEGPVTWDGGKCLGCRYCMLSCPFDIPKFEWLSANPEIRKCRFCQERVLAGQQPACAEACPTGATLFGERDKLLAEARQRLQSNPGQFQPRILGETEVGGTSFIYLSAIPFEKLGFPARLPGEKLPEYTWRVLSQIPNIVGLGMVFLGGLHWLNRRKNEVALNEWQDRHGRIGPQQGGNHENE